MKNIFVMQIKWHYTFLTFLTFNCSYKFHKINMETPVPESLF